jgi:hypothetical protein
LLDEHGVPLPPREGRLRAIDLDGASVTRIRLDGDDRSWDWRLVADRLVTARAEDETLAVWDARVLRCSQDRS